MKAAEDTSAVRFKAFGDYADEEVADQVEYIIKESRLKGKVRRNEAVSLW